MSAGGHPGAVLPRGHVPAWMDATQVQAIGDLRTALNAYRRTVTEAMRAEQAGEPAPKLAVRRRMERDALKKLNEARAALEAVLVEDT